MQMARAGFSAMLLTSEPEIRYFTGFLTRFWESPSRPWFVVLPAKGKPIAVIPTIGAALMAQSWVEDIRTWPAPRPDDDGISLLADTLHSVAGPGKTAVPMGYETYVRMPMSDFERLGAMGVNFVSDAGLVARLRSIKSDAEIEKIGKACRIAGRAFERVHEVAAEDAPLSEVFRRFQALLLEEGADWVPYLAGGAGPLGYSDVISPAGDTPLAAGDVLMMDTGAVWDGYFCDFDRNYVVGKADARAQAGWARLLEAAEAGRSAARAGARACDVWRAMAEITGSDEASGRLGHGLGMQLTEGLSLTAADQTVLQDGMVITLEPGVEIATGQIMVHEENIVIRDGAPEVLSPWASGPLPIL